MTGFLLARAEVQKLGYRICLDGLSTESFASINREKLGADLVKVQWNAETGFKHQGKPRNGRRRAGNGQQIRVILCRCDNRAAIEYGQAMGISLFQGRYIDGLLNPSAKVEN